MKWKRILAIGAHVDDIEVGAAGFLSRIVREGDFDTIRVVYLTKPSNVDGTQPIIPPVRKFNFQTEWEKAVKSWGFRFNDPAFGIHLHAFKIREFGYHRQEILDMFWSLKNGLKPDLVLVPSTQEFHQDHQVVTEEAIRAFQGPTTILGYEMPMISLPIAGTLYVPLEDRDREAKRHALNAYKSQHDRASMNGEAIDAMLTIRGNQCGAQYAEAFEVIRMVL